MSTVAVETEETPGDQGFTCRRQPLEQEDQFRVLPPSHREAASARLKHVFPPNRNTPETSPLQEVKLENLNLELSGLGPHANVCVCAQD